MIWRWKIDHRLGLNIEVHSFSCCGRIELDYSEKKRFLHFILRNELLEFKAIIQNEN
jgi:hypothetical protein